MSEEQREILKMVADKTITVEEAERLLKALEEGERARESRQPKDRGGVGAAFDALSDVLSDIGPMVRNAVEDAVSGVGFGPDEPDEEGFETVPWEKGPVIIPQGATLEIVQRRTGVRHGAGLYVEGVPGDACTIEGSGASDVRVYRQEGRVHIRWAHGDLKVCVPHTVAKVVARVMGGSIRSHEVACPVHLRTMGGNLELSGVAHPFDVKTMGGGVTLDLASGFRGDAKGHTMGGSIAATVPCDLSCTVHAVTMGGAVEIEGGMAHVQRSKAAGKQAVRVSLGQGPVCGSIALKTMGGSITVRRKDE